MQRRVISSDAQHCLFTVRSYATRLAGCFKLWVPRPYLSEQLSQTTNALCPKNVFENQFRTQIAFVHSNTVVTESHVNSTPPTPSLFNTQCSGHWAGQGPFCMASLFCVYPSPPQFHLVYTTAASGLCKIETSAYDSVPKILPEPCLNPTPHVFL
jgi:hypothetical protein